MVAFSNFSGVVWTENICRVLRVEFSAPRANDEYLYRVQVTKDTASRRINVHWNDNVYRRFTTRAEGELLFK